MSGVSSVVHLNVVDFLASVAVAKDRSLKDKAFVVAGSSSSRSVVLDLSRRAREEGLTEGMLLSAAQRRVPGILALPADETACALAEAEMRRISARYAPAVECSGGGHLYLDLAGTRRLFGPHVDCAARIRNEIVEALRIEPTVAVAPNKLVAKVGTRSVRPAGMTCIRPGEEASFLAPQDARLLPGVGPAVARVLSVAAFTEIGEIAALSDADARALFGPRGRSLRDAARGIDAAPVVSGALQERIVRRRLDFPCDVLDAAVIREALATLVEDAGLELRLAKLAAALLKLSVSYADGVRCESEERLRRALYLDAELIDAACRALARAGNRRVRVRALSLGLAALRPLSKQVDLFVPEEARRVERLQDSVDRTRTRFGPAALVRASALAASRSVGLPLRAAALRAR